MAAVMTFTDVQQFMHAAWGPRAEHDQDDKVLYDAIGARLSKLHDAVHAAIDQPAVVIDRLQLEDGPRDYLCIGFLREPGLEMYVHPDSVLHLRSRLVTGGAHARTCYSESARAWQTELITHDDIWDDPDHPFWLHLDTPRVEVLVGYTAISRWVIDYVGYAMPIRAAERLLGHNILLG